MKKDVDGNDVGERLPVFDYIAKKLVSINVENTMIKTEIQRVIDLPLDQRAVQKWCGTLKRTPGSIYKHDNLSVITGIGKKNNTRLRQYIISTQ
jgi:predicted flap endonuclease-1-like 5' DNA nuclease